MRPIKREEAPATTPGAGIIRRVLAHSPALMLVEHEFEGDTPLARHSHPHEQLIYIVSGRLRFAVEGEEPFEAGAGESFVIPGGREHEAYTLEPSVVLDCFTPAREDFLI